MCAIKINLVNIFPQILITPLFHFHIVHFGLLILEANRIPGIKLKNVGFSDSGRVKKFYKVKPLIFPLSLIVTKKKKKLENKKLLVNVLILNLILQNFCYLFEINTNL